MTIRTAILVEDREDANKIVVDFEPGDRRVGIEVTDNEGKTASILLTPEALFALISTLMEADENEDTNVDVGDTSAE